MITNLQEAITSRAQLEHVQGRIRSLIVQQGIIREQMSDQILKGEKITPMLSEKAKVDADLQSLTVTEAEITTDLDVWQGIEGRKLAQDARRALEGITAEARAVEAKYLEAVRASYPLLDRIDDLRKQYAAAHARAIATGGIGAEYGTGSISPSPRYPRTFRKMPRPGPTEPPTPYVRPMNMTYAVITESTDGDFAIRELA